MARDPIFDRAIQTAFTGAADQIKRLFVAEATRQLERAKSEARPSGFDQFVDRVKGAPLQSVDPYGVIVFEFSYGAEVVEFALATLRSISPVDSSDYQGGHHVYVDGVMVSDLSSLGTAKRIVIANTLPYARRIELPAKWRHGPMKGQARGWSIQPQVPQPKDSVYQHAVKTVNRRFGNAMRAEYAWVGLDGGAEVAGAEGNQSKIRYPAMVIEAV